MHLAGKGFAEIAVGDTFGAAMTVTESHITRACGMFGDFNPLHCNQSFAEASLFGGRVLHGPFTSALIAAPVGMFYEGTAIAYLEHNCRFIKPVYAGDTLTTTWSIVEKIAKARYDGGVVRMSATCVNQDGNRVAEADGAILVGNRSGDFSA